MSIRKVQGLQSTLGALIKAKENAAKFRQKQLNEERLSQIVKNVAKSSYQNPRYELTVSKHVNTSISDYIQKMNGEMTYKDSIWAPWTTFTR